MGGQQYRVTTGRRPPGSIQLCVFAHAKQNASHPARLHGFVLHARVRKSFRPILWCVPFGAMMMGFVYVCVRYHLYLPRARTGRQRIISEQHPFRRESRSHSWSIFRPIQTFCVCVFFFSAYNFQPSKKTVALPVQSVGSVSSMYRNAWTPFKTRLIAVPPAVRLMYALVSGFNAIGRMNFPPEL